ncbi:MAG TPA: NAD(P)-dependent alcohol dehydrogenase [Terriglobales bacterium]|nr:NAD(P)-dependent alcohol dehydrogenase [Terriglobales bacterium]
MSHTVEVPEQSNTSAKTTKALGYAAQSATSPLAPFSFERRVPGPKDVQIQILYCGVCHSDLHTVRNEWNNTIYPSLPGHEIVGRVTAVGNEVKKFKVGQVAAVGCMVGSCGTCPNCKQGYEQYCDVGFVGTYNGEDKVLGGMTYGGYSTHVVVDEHFVLSVPENLQDNLAAVAPLLCAGITTYSPLHHWKVGPGQKVGVVGLGGLGHMAVKIAAAMGAHVVLFTTSPNKKDDALRLGAKEIVVTRDPANFEKHLNSFDFILDCVSAQHDINQYLNLLKRDGTLTLVGAPEKPLPAEAFSLIFKRRQFAGSLIGGIPETQEMLDFCGKHNIVSDIEIIPIQKINEAYERMLKSDVKYRFVIDMASLQQ